MTRDRSSGHAGEWAELELVVVEPGERAPGLPADTAATPYRARVKGFLEADARVGEPAAVGTLAGRRVVGVLLRVAPAPGHSFGEPVEELLAAGRELSERLASPGTTDG